MPTWTITVESQHIEETLELLREQGVFFETENNMTALSDLGTYATGAMGPAAVREMNEALAIRGRATGSGSGTNWTSPRCTPSSRRGPPSTSGAMSSPAALTTGTLR